MKKFENVIKASGAESGQFEVLNEGIFLTEQELSNTDDRLAELEQSSATAITERDAAVSARDTAQAELATANETITAHEATIAGLNSRIAELEKNPAGEFEGKGKDEEFQGGAAEKSDEELAPSLYEAAKFYSY